LGKYKKVKKLIIEWPGGKKTSLKNVESGQQVEVREK
jgi:hypothetical protein